MRRLLAPLMAASLLMLLPAVLAGANAAPALGSTPAVTGNCAPPYPPPPAATVEVSTTVPHVGDPLDISGIGYCADEDVHLLIAGKRVGIAHTDTDGHFNAVRVTTHGPPGNKQVCGIGVSKLLTDQDCQSIDVRAAGSSSSASPPPPSGQGGGTAFTGVRIALLGVAALVLVVGGVVVTTLGRNRRPERA